MIIIYSALLSIIFVGSFIQFAKKYGWGKSIRKAGPKSHLSKEGTATMGGIGFLLAAILSYFIWGQHSQANLVLVLLSLAAALVGFYDDILSLRKKSKIAQGEDASTGLLARYRLLGQGIFALSFSIYAANNGHSMFANYYLDIAGFVIVVMGMINAVNFTDGLDGLAAGVSLIILIVFIELSFPKALIGALIGFLWYNSKPARVFMGGVGSEALGAAIAATAILADKVWYLPLIAIVPLMEMISVIVQVSYFKLSNGKRIFKMTPIHHHFELSGWPETKVVARFYIFTALAVFVALISQGKLS